MTSPAELVLSASSLKTWLSCGRKYWYEQILRMPGAPNMAMSIGTAVHAGVEALHKGAPEPLKATETAFAAEMMKMGGSVIEDPVGGFHDAEMMLRLYQSKVAPTFRPTMVEQSFVIRINGTLVSGQIDVADDQDQVRDTKTTRTLSKFRPDRHRLQLTLYGLAFRAITGRKPRRLLLDVVARNLRYKTVEIEPDEEELVDVLTIVSEGIKAGRFDPTGTMTSSCARCPFSGGTCEYAVID